MSYSVVKELQQSVEMYHIALPLVFDILDGSTGSYKVTGALSALIIAKGNAHLKCT